MAENVGIPTIHLINCHCSFWKVIGRFIIILYIVHLVQVITIPCFIVSGTTADSTEDRRRHYWVLSHAMQGIALWLLQIDGNVEEMKCFWLMFPGYFFWQCLLQSLLFRHDLDWFGTFSKYGIAYMCSMESYIQIFA